MKSDFILFPQNVLESFEKRRSSLPGKPVTLALLGIIGSEATIFYGRIGYALWGYLIVLLLCSLGPLRFENDANVLQALVLIPVYRIVNLSMPVFFEQTLYWLLFLYVPLVPASYLVIKSQSLDLPLGWKRALLLFPLVIPVGAGLGVLEYSIIEPAPFVQEWALNDLLLIGIVMFGFVALAEELLFRGLIQRAFENQLGRPTGIVITSALFGLMHGNYGIPLEFLYGAFLGLLLGLVYDYSDSLLTVVIMHGTLNFFLFVVVPHHPWIGPYLTSLF